MTRQLVTHDTAVPGTVWRPVAWVVRRRLLILLALAVLAGFAWGALS